MGAPARRTFNNHGGQPRHYRGEPGARYEEEHSSTDSRLAREEEQMRQEAQMMREAERLPVKRERVEWVCLYNSGGESSYDRTQKTRYANQRIEDAYQDYLHGGPYEVEIEDVVCDRHNGVLSF